MRITFASIDFYIALNTYTKTHKTETSTFVSENRKQKTDTQNRDTGWHTHTFQRGSPYLQFGSLV